MAKVLIYIPPKENLKWFNPSVASDEQKRCVSLGLRPTGFKLFSDCVKKCGSCSHRDNKICTLAKRTSLMTEKIKLTWPVCVNYEGK